MARPVRDSQFTILDDLRNRMDNLEKLVRGGRPTVRLTHSENQNIAPDTIYDVKFDTALVNTGGMWSNGQPTRITVKEPGQYLFWGFFFCLGSPPPNFSSLIRNRAGVLEILSYSPQIERLMDVEEFAAGDFLTLTTNNPTIATSDIVIASSSAGGNSYTPVFGMAQLSGEITPLDLTDILT